MKIIGRLDLDRVLAGGSCRDWDFTRAWCQAALSLSRWSLVVLCCPLINEVYGGEGVLLGQATHLTVVVVGSIFFSKRVEGLHCVVWDGTGDPNAYRIASP